MSELAGHTSKKVQEMDNADYMTISHRIENDDAGRVAISEESCAQQEDKRRHGRKRWSEVEQQPR